jgi:hypothetical protein
MKKLYFFLFPLLSFTFTQAQTFDFNGINYNITDTTNFCVAVGDNFFYSQTSVTIPNTVVYNSQNYTVTSISDNAFNSSNNLTSVTIPNSVISIGNGAFAECHILTSVTIPNSVTSIGNNAFYLCSSLTSVSIPNSVTSIGSDAFVACSSLTTVSIPNSVTSIGSNAFRGCNSLMSVTIPNSVTSIVDGVFYECRGLTSINIPNSVTTIGNNAFGGCIGLTSINIPNSVTSIGIEAFVSCTGLTTITLPNSLTSIGSVAFAYCTGLTTVNCYVTTPLVISSGVFANVNQAVCALNVPIGSEALYEAAAVWTDFNPINGNLLGTNSFDLKNNSSVYPNPASEIVTIELSNTIQLQKVNFYNALGQMVKTTNTATTTISDLAQGDYFVEIITDKGKTTKKIIKD